MPTSSSSSAAAIYLDRQARLNALPEAARRAAARMPLIRRIVLFGSLVAGIPTPRSDADPLVLVETSPHRHPRDRVPEVLAALGALPCPVDLLVVTVAEFAAALDGGAPLARTIAATGVDLL